MNKKDYSTQQEKVNKKKKKTKSCHKLGTFVINTP